MIFGLTLGYVWLSQKVFDRSWRSFSLEVFVNRVYVDMISGKT